MTRRADHLLLAFLAQVVVADFIVLPDQMLNLLLHLLKLLPIYNRFEHALLHVFPKSFERFVNSLAPAVIPDVIADDVEHFLFLFLLSVAEIKMDFQDFSRILSYLSSPLSCFLTSTLRLRKSLGLSDSFP